MTGRVLVVNLGQTGVSFARHYLSRGFEVEVVDERDDPPGLAALSEIEADVPVRKVEKYSGLTDVARFDKVLVSPGVAPHRLPHGVRATGDLECFLECFHRRWQGDPQKSLLVAVTGTNGKSTVARLAAGMLSCSGERASAVGNIGVPLLDALEQWEQGGWPRFVVAELSSYQLAQLGKGPRADVACIVNITRDHVQWHQGQEGYVRAKLSVFDGAGTCVFNRQCPDAVGKASAAGRSVGFGGEQSVDGEWRVSDGAVVEDGADGLHVDCSLLAAKGVMPLSACAALAVAGCAAPEQDVGAHVEWLRGAKGLEHRFEFVEVANGVRFINDSKATNEAAALQALDTVDGPCVLIVGGDDKGQDFNKLAQAAQGKVASVVVMGREEDKITKALAGAGVPVTLADGMDMAVSVAADRAVELGVGTVLLSPACSSQDRYECFAHRGDDFRSCVARLSVREKARA